MLLLEQVIAAGEVKAAAWSPDGARVAFVWQREGVSRLWVFDAGGGFPELLSPHAIVMDSPAEAPSWSPDGSQMLYLSKAAGTVNLWTVPAAGGAPKRITRGPGKESAPRWSPDGRRIAYLTDRDGYDQVAVVDAGPDGAAAGWPRPVVRLPLDCRDPQWSPDGSAIAFQGLDAMDDHSLCIVGVETGELRRVRSQGRCSFHSPRWSPDGKQIVCIGDGTGVANLWLVRVAAMGEAEPISTDEEEKGAPCWSPDGLSIAYTFNRKGYIGIAVMQVSALAHREVVPATGVAAEPAWSPDGTRLLYLYSDSRQAPDLYTQSPAVDDQPRRLTRSMPAGLSDAGLGEPELVEYPGGLGLTIPAFLYKPPQAARGGKFPLIVYPHGGPTAQHTPGWHPFLQYFILKGYGVLAPNFRGSTGYGRAFELANRGEWGKLDLEDVLQAARHARTLPWVDPDRIGIWGGSYGGYMTLLALSKAPGTFRCGVDFYGVSNRFTSWRDTDRIGKRNIERKLGRPTENLPLYREASPLVYQGNISDPLLIMHGEEDPRVPFGQSVEMVETLRQRGFPVQFHAYPGEGHGFLKPQHLHDIYTKVEQFFSLYL